MPFQRAVTALVREQLSKWLTKHCVCATALKLNRNPSSSSSKTEAKVDDELKHAILAAIARSERPSSGKPTPSTPNAAATSSEAAALGSEEAVAAATVTHSPCVCRRVSAWCACDPDEC